MKLKFDVQGRAQADPYIFEDDGKLYLYVTAKDRGGNILFDDLYKNMSGLQIPSESGISFEVDARWYEDSSREYYGEIKYSFDADISAPAV